MLLSEIIQKRQEQATFSLKDSEWIFLSILAKKYETHTYTNHDAVFSCNCLSAACSSFLSLSSTHLHSAIFFQNFYNLSQVKNTRIFKHVIFLMPHFPIILRK
jgi:hypothetical protein